jgi:hypothetical protein
MAGDSDKGNNTVCREGVSNVLVLAICDLIQKLEATTGPVFDLQGGTVIEAGSTGVDHHQSLSQLLNGTPNA